MQDFVVRDSRRHLRTAEHLKIFKVRKIDQVYRPTPPMGTPASTQIHPAASTHLSAARWNPHLATCNDHRSHAIVPYTLSYTLSMNEHGQMSRY
jgi:hypothetical protein